MSCKKTEKCRTVLAGYYACLSCILLLIRLGWGHTHTDTHIHQLPKQNKFQETWHVPACG